MSLTKEVNERVERIAEWYIEKVKRLVERMEEDGVPVFFEKIEAPTEEPE